MITGDFETRSHADLPKVGTVNYARHPTTEVICFAYGIDEEPIQTWWPGKMLTGSQAWPKNSFGAADKFYCPRDLYEAIAQGHEFEAHNVSFEKSIWEFIMRGQYHWPLIRSDKWRDTAAVAAYYALPPKLDKLAQALELGSKNPEGGRLISRYSKLHLKTAKEDIPPEDFEKFVQYCVDDVALEQDVSDRLGDLPPEELAVFLLDQRINERGIPLDVNSINDAIEIVDKRAEELSDAFRKLTGYAPTQYDRIMDWFKAQGAELDNLQADYLEKVLAGDTTVVLTKTARAALSLRLKHAKASTKKLAAMKRYRVGRACEDEGPLDEWNRDSKKPGRAYYQTRYHGTVTGRWAGTGFQPLNLSKGFEDVPPDRLVTDLSHRSPRWLDIMYGDAMEAVGKASRHHIRAEKGNRIIAGDFVSIEAVLLACLAGEEWKIDAFRKGEPIYELMGCSIHNLPESAIKLAKENKKKFKQEYSGERFDGKTGELAFGYQGALGAWRKFDSSDRHSDARVIEICKAWREKHPAIVRFWHDLEDAAIQAVMHPGKVFEVRDIAFEVIHPWLAMHLPNNKRIWYFNPQLRMAMPQWHKPEEDEDCAAGTCSCKERLQLTYMAQKEGRWYRVNTYGGKLCLTGDTKVLTDRGWVAILDVTLQDRLWDGKQWVGHLGVVHQGTKEVCRLGGVGMTPDHLVLTTGGWVSASQSAGFNRAESWLPNGGGVCWERWEEVPLASTVRLREIGHTTGGRVTEAEEPRHHRFLRMQEERNNKPQENTPWNVQASSVLCLAVDDRQMHFAFSSSLGELWRAGYNCLRKVGTTLREFLGGHGADISPRAPDRTHGQRQRVLTRELPMGNARRSSSQPTYKHVHKHPCGQNDGISSVQVLRSESYHHPLPYPTRVAGHQSVYDIAEAGPNHRFVVRDEHGLPLIVHNCENATQAASREILVPAMFRVEKAKYPIILTIYDEIVTEVPFGRGSAKELEEIMTERVGDWAEFAPRGSCYYQQWAKGWPVRADAWEGDRYRK